MQSKLNRFFVIVGLMLTGSPDTRAADSFDTLHEVIRHFQLAFVERANTTALLLGALQGLKKALPEARIEIQAKPDVIRVEFGAQAMTIPDFALLNLTELEKYLQEAAGLAIKQAGQNRRKDIEHGMIRQMVAHCGDPWSNFLEGDLYRKLLEDDSQQSGFAGLLVEAWRGSLRVLDVVRDSPAEKAGLLVGMAIDQVAGHPATDLNELEALALLRGPVGHKVTVNADGRRYDLTLEAEPKRNIEVNPLGNGYARVHLLNFRVDTGKRLAAVLSKLGAMRPDGLKGLILDLRGNPGGLVTEGTAVAGLFMDAGTVVSLVSKKHLRVETERNPAPGPYRNLPLVLLVDHRSASVSEIVSMALRDSRRVPLVGTQTLGKGTVQVLLELMDGSALKLSTGRYFSPKGTPIYEGIQPDVLATWNGRGQDAQLAKALETLKRR